ncbi:hypothetical protein TNCV_3200161 [Trichonephila clavipes]|nr:hypothetical protein TNCV_3200161 [Trichonephila clavipes]
MAQLSLTKVIRAKGVGSPRSEPRCLLITILCSCISLLPKVGLLSRLALLFCTKMIRKNPATHSFSYKGGRRQP